MIPLLRAQPLVFQLDHDLIEQVNDTVSLFLPCLLQPGTEILLLQQIHAVTDRVERSDRPSIKIEQEKEG